MKTDKFPNKAFAIQMLGKKAFDDLMTRTPSEEELRNSELEVAELFNDPDLADFDEFMKDEVAKCMADDELFQADIRPAPKGGAVAETYLVASPPGSTHISIRIPTWLLDALKRKAKAQGVRYQTFIKRILVSNLTPA